MNIGRMLHAISLVQKFAAIDALGICQNSIGKVARRPIACNGIMASIFAISACLIEAMFIPRAVPIIICLIIVQMGSNADCTICGDQVRCRAFRTLIKMCFLLVAAVWFRI